MTGIILAGGENRRMGTDKAFLEMAGRPLVENIFNLFSRLFERTIIVTNSPERYRSYDVEVVTDAMDVRGPLTGIYSGLLRSRDEHNFVAACDMPFLNSRLIAHLGEIAPGYDAVVPRVGDLLEPLHAVYSRTILSKIESQMARGERRIQGLFGSLNIRYVPQEEIMPYDPLLRSFKNVNTPEEYKEAACLD
jgi:molybdopterin-guanine dinucleotide biosynthesis protein A